MLGRVRKRALVLGAFFTNRQQHRQVFGRQDDTAAADQGGHEALAKLPLRRLVVTAAQLIEDGVDFVKLVRAQGLWRKEGTYILWGLGQVLVHGRGLACIGSFPCLCSRWGV